MSKKGHSSPNFWGGYTHYDDKGHKTGSSYPGFFGGYTHYDENGHRSGHSSPGFFGGYSHYDSRGHKTGSSGPGLFGGYNHYNSSGRKSGGSYPGMFGSYHHNDTGGCYVATCVYGSYDCPQVWTLRRFRDDILAQSFAGRLFIRGYYAVSPTIVRWFGERKWFKSFWKRKLDALVTKLRNSGVEDTPYKDKQWKK